MHAEIIAIGDEITSGQLLDTNTQWLSQRLEELGIRVLYHTTVGDELEPCAEVFRQAIGRADVVVATGGLGPTADDLTREAIAQAAGRELVLDPEALEHDPRHVRPAQAADARAERAAGDVSRRGPDDPQPQRHRARDRPGGAARRDRPVPRVRPARRAGRDEGDVARVRSPRRSASSARGGGMIRHRRINCFGAGESQIEAMLPDLIRRGRTPDRGHQRQPDHDHPADHRRRGHRRGVPAPPWSRPSPPSASCLGTLVFGEDDDELQDAVVRLLRQQDKTLATAEWGTAGLVAEWLDDVAEAEGYYLGGVVAAGERALRRRAGRRRRAARPHARPPAARWPGRWPPAAASGLRPTTAWPWAAFRSSTPRPPSRSRSSSPWPRPTACEVKAFPYAGHPATLKIFCAKRALNLVRLAMLESS